MNDVINSTQLGTADDKRRINKGYGKTGDARQEDSGCLLPPQQPYTDIDCQVQ